MILNIRKQVDAYTRTFKNSIETGGIGEFIAFMAACLLIPSGGTSTKIQVFDPITQALRDIKSSDLAVDQTIADPAGKIGFATGAGGAVTQITSITTGVTLSKNSGAITTVSSTLAAGASIVFTVTNTLVGANDVPSVAVGTYAGAGIPVARVKNVVAGAYDIVLTNAHASAALNAAVPINTVILKGAIA